MYNTSHHAPCMMIFVAKKPHELWCTGEPVPCFHERPTSHESQVKSADADFKRSSGAGWSQVPEPVAEILQILTWMNSTDVETSFGTETLNHLWTTVF